LHAIKFLQQNVIPIRRYIDSPIPMLYISKHGTEKIKLRLLYLLCVQNILILARICRSIL